MDPQSTPPQSEQGPAQDAAESQNPAACAPPPFRPSSVTSASTSDDVKRTDAASLARQLATSSSWFDTFMPRSYGTANTTPLHLYTPTRTEEQGNMYPQDPPPRYSRTPEVHELPAESIRHDTPAEPQQPATLAVPSSPPQDPDTAIPLPSEHTPPESTQEVNTETTHQTQDVESNDETPLLSDVVARSVQPVRGWWARRKSQKLNRRRRIKIFCFFFTTLLVAAFILSLCIGIRKDTTWFHHPSTPTATFVPTGREYERHLALGNIDGRYKLYDRLDLSTTTGSIDIEIDPQEGDLPAILALSSNLGSITLRVSPEYLHRRHRAQRTFQTTISSLQGTVTAEILLGHGGTALVDTTFGAQMLSVIGQGLGPLDEISNLTTLSRTGVQRIIVTSLSQASVPLAHLRSRHHVFGAASMDIQYPTTWQGEVQAVAAPVGNVVIEGDGLEYRRSDDFGIIARRKFSNATTTVEIVNEGIGDIVFRC